MAASSAIPYSGAKFRHRAVMPFSPSRQNICTPVTPNSRERRQTSSLLSTARPRAGWSFTGRRMSISPVLTAWASSPSRRSSLSSPKAAYSRDCSASSNRRPSCDRAMSIQTASSSSRISRFPALACRVYAPVSIPPASRRTVKAATAACPHRSTSSTGVKKRTWKERSPVRRTKAVSECFNSPASARIRVSRGKSACPSRTTPA